MKSHKAHADQNLFMLGLCKSQEQMLQETSRLPSCLDGSRINILPWTACGHLNTWCLGSLLT